MQVYNYSPATGEYLSVGIAERSPLDVEEVYFIPANATETAPPTAGQNQVAVFANGAWTLQDDYRGTEYWLPDHSYHVIEAIGQTLPANAVTDEAALPVLPRMVDAERDRRTSVFPYNGTSFQMDFDSQQLVIAAGASAKFAIGAGAQAGNLRWANPNKDFAWWDVDNVRHTMDAQEMSAFADAAQLWVADHRDAARTIKDIDPIPTDYADDTRWP